MKRRRLIISLLALLGGGCKPKSDPVEKVPEEKSKIGSDFLRSEKWDTSQLQNITVEEASELFVGRTRNFDSKYKYFCFFSFADDNRNKIISFPKKEISLEEFLRLLIEKSGSSLFEGKDFLLIHDSGSEAGGKVEFGEEVAKETKGEMVSVFDLAQTPTDEIVSVLKSISSQRGVALKMIGDPKKSIFNLSGPPSRLEVILKVAGRLLRVDWVVNQN